MPNFVRRSSIVGAVLIKNYASLDKNEKNFHVFILKIATYQSTQKILYLLKGLRELKREPKLPSLADFVNQLLHQNNCKINPCGIEFAMIILRPSGFGNIVARGLNLCVPLQSQNCEFAAPGGKNCLTCRLICRRVQMSALSASAAAAARESKQ
jgi:hypothetical protein